MANSKNRRNNGNNHRRSMQRRCSGLKYREKMARKQFSHQRHGDESLHGSRIINLDKLQQFIDQLTAHTKQCSGSQIILSGEKQAGLASIISSRCSKWSFNIPLTTSHKVHGPKGISRWEANLAAVWGQMMTGGGHSKLQETMSTLGIPVMSPKNFIVGVIIGKATGKLLFIGVRNKYCTACTQGVPQVL